MFRRNHRSFFSSGNRQSRLANKARTRAAQSDAKLMAIHQRRVSRFARWRRVFRPFMPLNLARFRAMFSAITAFFLQLIAVDRKSARRRPAHYSSILAHQALEPRQLLAVVADAGGQIGDDYFLAEGTEVTLDASGSTGPIITYEWDIDNDGIYDDGLGVSPTFTWAQLEGLGINNDGTYEIGLQVTDASANIDQDTAFLQISNVAPTVDAGGPYMINEGDTLNLNGSATDPSSEDQANLIFSWDLDNDGEFNDFLGATGAVPYSVLSQFVPDDGTYTIGLLSVDDNDPSTDTATLIIGNSAPELDGPILEEFNEGDTPVVTGDISDSPLDLDTMDMSVVSVSGGPTGTVSNTGGTWTWDAGVPADDQAGPYAVTIMAVDNDLASDTFTFFYTVVNVAPEVSTEFDVISQDEAEGTFAENTIFVSDVPGDTVTVTASTGTVSDNGDGSWSWQAPADDDVPLTTVTITASDEDGGSSSTTFTYEVLNAAPELASPAEGGFFLVDESDTTPITINGTVIDPGTDVVLVSSSPIGSISKSGENWTWTYLPADDLPLTTVTITAIDSDGGSDTLEFTVAVLNVDPGLTVDNGSVSVTEGGVATNSGTYDDVNADPITLTASIGTIMNNGDGTYDWAYNATGETPPSTVIITANDGDGGIATVTFSLNVDNAPPVLTINNPNLVVAESDTGEATNTGTYSDALDDTVTITQLSGPGTTVDNGDGTFTWTETDITDNQDTTQVVIEAEDNDGASATITFDFTIVNLNPIVGVDNSLIVVMEDEGVENSGTFSDVAADDVIITASEGDISQNNDDGTWSWSLASTTEPGIYPVTITATDDDGGSSTVVFNYAVTNADPEITGVDDIDVDEADGSTATMTFSAMDPGGGDITVEAVDGGLGTLTDNMDGTYTYSIDADDDIGPVTVFLTAEDSNGGVAFDSFTVQVNNLAPNFSVSSDPVNVDESDDPDAATNGGFISDVAGDTPVSLSVQSGPGTVVDNGDGSWSWSGPAADGDSSYDVVLQADDGDGGLSTVAFTVNVANIAPEVVLAETDLLVPEGTAPATNSFTVSDVAADTVTVTVENLSGDDDGTLVDNGDGTFDWSFPNPGNQSSTITFLVTASDSDGGIDAKSFDLTFVNAAPELTINDSSVVTSEGGLAVNSGTYNDPGTTDTVVDLYASIGTAVDNGDGTFSWSLPTGNQSPLAEVIIYAEDNDGSVGSVAFDLIVVNIPPNVTIDDAVVLANEGEEATNSGTVTDPYDSVTLSASLGSVTDNGDGTFSWSYTAPDQMAPTTVTIFATDDLTTTSTTFTLVVANVAPSLTINETTVLGTEGTVAENGGMFGDPGNDTVTLSASIGTVSDNGDGTYSWEYLSLDDFGPTTVTITASDEDGGVSTVTFTLTIANVAPIVDVDEVPAINEGDSVSTTVTFFDPGVNDNVTPSASIGTISDNGDGTYTWSFDSTDSDESQTVTIYGTDDDGGSGSATFDLVINNVAPTLTIEDAVVDGLDEGDTATNSGTYSDPGTGDELTLTASLGEVTDNGDGTYDWTYDSIDDFSGTVTITIMDDDGGSSAQSFFLSIANVAPVLTDDSPVITPEGTVGVKNGTVDDVEGDDVLLSTSLGTVVNNGDGTFTWTAPSNDDANTTVFIFANDQDGGSSFLIFDYQVINVDPTVTIENDAVAGTEGGPDLTNSGTYSDPVDAVSVFLLSGPGSVTDNGNGTFDWSYTPADDTSDTVVIAAIDDDGGSSTVTFTVDVSNVDPTIAIDNVLVDGLTEGDLAINTGTFGDLGILDTHTFSASLGSVTPAADGTFTWSYVTEDDFNGVVTITVEDDDGGSATTFFALSVGNADPVIEGFDSGSVTVDEGQTATNMGDFSDPGVSDTFTFSASLGTVSDNGDGSFTWMYDTVDDLGPDAVITVFIQDDDGGITSDTFNLTVNNVDPTVDVDQTIVTADEGTIATNSGTYGDAGVLDTVTLSASQGTITDNGDGTWSWAQPVPDQSTGAVVIITAMDDDGGASSTVFILNVANLPPQLTLDESAIEANEGDTIINGGTYTDAPGDLPLTFAVTSGPGTVTDNGDGTFTYTYESDDDLPMTTVTIRATDDEGAFSEVSFDLTINNVDPILTIALETVNVDEGTPATNFGTISDVDGDTPVGLSASSGSISDNGDGTWSWTSGGALDQGGPFTVTITADDGDGGIVSDTFTYTVNNAAPNLTVEQPNFSTVESDGGTLVAFGTFSDVPNDPVTLSVSPNDIGTFVASPGNAGSWSLTIDAEDDFPLTGFTVTAVDDEGASSTVSFTMEVLNDPPVVSNLPEDPVTGDEGSTQTFDFNVNDPVSADTIVSVTASVGVVTANGGDSYTWTYDATDDFDGTVTITAIDDDGGEGTGTFDMTISNLPPEAEANGPYTLAEGGSVMFDATGSTDPSAPDTSDLSFLWDINNDGVYGDVTGIMPTVDWATFEAFGVDNDTNGSSIIVGLRVFDGDGGSDDDLTLLTIDNTLPTADAGGPYEVTVGDGVVLNGSAFEPASGDLPLTFTWELTQNNQFDDASGESVPLTSAELAALGLVNAGDSIPIYMRVFDDEGFTEVSTTITLVGSDDVAVDGLFLDSTSWANNFRDWVDGGFNDGPSLGTSDDGLARGIEIVDPSVSISQNNVDLMRIEFSDDVGASLDTGDFQLTGDSGFDSEGNPGVVPSIVSVSSDGVITLDGPMGPNLYELTVFAAGISTPGGDTLPSDMVFEFVVLPGDAVDQHATTGNVYVVNATDAADVRNRLGGFIFDALGDNAFDGEFSNYDARADIDGSGTITAADFGYVRNTLSSFVLDSGGWNFEGSGADIDGNDSAGSELDSPGTDQNGPTKGLNTELAGSDDGILETGTEETSTLDEAVSGKKRLNSGENAKDRAFGALDFDADLDNLTW